jgi:hypothetical protein
MTNALSVRLTLGDPSRSAAYVLLSGLAWGFLVATFGSLSAPPLELSLADYFTFYSRILLHYGAAGILLAWCTSRISKFDRGIPVWMAVVPVIAATTMVALLIDRLSLHVPFWRNDLMAAMAPRLSDLAAHLGWVVSVYGGLYMMAFFLLQNEARTHERLRLAELDRLSAEARVDHSLAESRLPSVPSELLLQAISELAQRYGDNHRRADCLLDILVQLLRSASMPAPKGIAGKFEPQRGADLAVNLDQLRAELGQLGEDSIASDVNVPQQEVDHGRIGNQ